MVKDHWEMDYFKLLSKVCIQEDFEKSLEYSNSKGIKPIHIASACGNLSFLYSKIDVLSKSFDSKGNSAAHYACYFNQPRILQVILSKYKDCLTWKNNDEQIPISFAFANGSSDIILSFKDEIQQVIDHIDKYGNNMMLLSSFSNNLLSFEFLSKYISSKSVNHLGQSVLHRVVQCNASSIELFENLMKLKVPDNPFPLFDINQVDNKGCTPLHLLCLHQKTIPYLQLLLSYENIDVNAKDNDGNSPLHYCAYTGNTKFLKILLNFPNVDAFPLNSKRRTPLDTAAFFGHVKIVKKFLKFGQNFNNFAELKDINGRTPVHAAAIRGCIDCLQILSDFFDINEEDSHGRSPIQILILHRDRELIEEFINIGAILKPKERDLLIKFGWKPSLSIITQNSSDNLLDLHDNDDDDNNLSYSRSSSASSLHSNSAAASSEIISNSDLENEIVRLKEEIERLKMNLGSRIDELELENENLKADLSSRTNGTISVPSEPSDSRYTLLEQELDAEKGKNSLLQLQLKQKDQTIQHIQEAAALSISRWQQKCMNAISSKISLPSDTPVSPRMSFSKRNE